MTLCRFAKAASCSVFIIAVLSLVGPHVALAQGGATGAITGEVLDSTGAVIPNEKLRDIFKTFYTTKQQGTGLGLSITRTIVEAYGGKIWAENRTSAGRCLRPNRPESCKW